MSATPREPVAGERPEPALRERLSDHADYLRALAERIRQGISADRVDAMTLDTIAAALLAMQGSGTGEREKVLEDLHVVRDSLLSSGRYVSADTVGRAIAILAQGSEPVEEREPVGEQALANAFYEGWDASHEGRGSRYTAWEMSETRKRAPTLGSEPRQQWHTELDHVASLPKGWDSYDCPPPNPQAVALAHRILNALEIEPVRIAPVNDGGIIIWLRDTAIEVGPREGEPRQPEPLYLACPACGVAGIHAPDCPQSDRPLPAKSPPVAASEPDALTDRVMKEWEKIVPSELGIPSRVRQAVQRALTTTPEEPR